MAEREQPYDPYIPSGGQGGAQPAGGNQRTAALQAVRAIQKSIQSGCDGMSLVFTGGYCILLLEVSQVKFLCEISSRTFAAPRKRQSRESTEQQQLSRNLDRSSTQNPRL